MQNSLKKGTYEVFQRLLKSEIPLKIISGDNDLTVTNNALNLNLFSQENNKIIYHLNTNHNGFLYIETQKNNEIKFEIAEKLSC